MLEIEYQGNRMKYDGYSVNEAIKQFRDLHGLKGKRLNGQMIVSRLGATVWDSKVVKFV